MALLSATSLCAWLSLHPAILKYLNLRSIRCAFSPGITAQPLLMFALDEVIEVVTT
jgi:hypothetical protein